MAAKWNHPGGKLIERGPASLSDAEILAILIAPGIKGKPALAIAEEVLARYGSFEGMSNRPLQEFTEFKGLGDVKVVRMAAAMEIARRVIERSHQKRRASDEEWRRYKEEHEIGAKGSQRA